MQYFFLVAIFIANCSINGLSSGWGYTILHNYSTIRREISIICCRSYSGSPGGNEVMIYRIFFLTVFLLLIQPAQGHTQSRIVIEDFEFYSDNIFTNWKARKTGHEKIYKLLSLKGNRFLRASSFGDSIQIARKVEWSLRTHPVLSWKWRVLKKPEAGNEAIRGKNDSAAAIYVIFQRSKIPFLSWKYQPVNVIKYVCSSSLPVGRVVSKDKIRLGQKIYEGKFIVLRSGLDEGGKWITEKRNVLLDYRRVFGESPKYSPYLIGILTDSNDTQSSAIADYDDIVILAE